MKKGKRKNITIGYPDSIGMHETIIKKIFEKFIENNADILAKAYDHVLQKQHCYTCKYGVDRFSPDSILYCENDKAGCNIVRNP